MEKIKFNIDDLKVESFDTSETQPVRRGTVKGMSIYPDATVTGLATACNQSTCLACVTKDGSYTCANQVTCANTCNQSTCYCS
jgi:hypothetical protein